MDLSGILSATMGGQPALDAWYALHPSEITAQLAGALVDAADDAMTGQRFSLAVVAAMAAAQTFERIGAEAESLQATWHSMVAMYMTAQTPPMYDHVRDGALGTALAARSKGYLVLAFKVFTLAADCSFWASETSANAVDKRDWLVRCLEDLKLAGDLAAVQDVVTIVPQDEFELHRYASTAGAVFYRSRATDFGDLQATVDGLFVELAAATERMVPLEFAVPGDQGKTEYLARRLAEISNEFGNPQIAARRRAFASQLS